MWQSIMSIGNRIYTGTFFDSHPISNEEKRKTIEKMYGQYKKKNFAAVPEILPQELELALLSGEEVILVDCRDKNEREVGTIKGALVMDEVSFSDIETDVVLFCTVGFRSGVKGKSLMNENPNLKVKNLKGGILLVSLHFF